MDIPELLRHLTTKSNYSKLTLADNELDLNNPEDILKAKEIILSKFDNPDDAISETLEIVSMSINKAKFPMGYFAKVMNGKKKNDSQVKTLAKLEDHTKIYLNFCKVLSGSRYAVLKDLYKNSVCRDFNIEGKTFNYKNQRDISSSLVWMLQTPFIAYSALSIHNWRVHEFKSCPLQSVVDYIERYRLLVKMNPIPHNANETVGKWLMGIHESYTNLEWGDDGPIQGSLETAMLWFRIFWSPTFAFVKLKGKNYNLTKPKDQAVVEKAIREYDKINVCHEERTALFITQARYLDSFLQAGIVVNPVQWMIDIFTRGWDTAKDDADVPACYFGREAMEEATMSIGPTDLFPKGVRSDMKKTLWDYRQALVANQKGF